MGKFRFDNYDSKRSLARFSGALEIEQMLNSKLPGLMTGKGSLKIQSNLESHRIESMQFKGDLLFKGEGEQPDGKGTFNIELKSAVGARAKAAALAKPKYRVRSYNAPSLGITFELPSCWAEFETDEDGHVLMARAAEYDSAPVHISFTYISTRVPDMNQYFKDIDASAKRKPDLLKITAVSCKLGKVRSHTYEVENEERGKVRMISEFYPFRDSILVIKFSGAPSTTKKYKNVFVRARKSLELMDE